MPFVASTIAGFLCDPMLGLAVPWEGSYGGPPKAGSKVVNNRLWELHDYMSTDCFGSTDADYIQSGRHLFNIYNLNWKWGLYRSISLWIL